MSTTESLSKEEVARSLQTFKDRRDAVVGGDTDHFSYNLSRFVSFCEQDELAMSVIAEFEDSCEVDPAAFAEETERTNRPPFPDVNVDEEACTRWAIIKVASDDVNYAWRFGSSFGGNGMADYVNHFRTLVVKPFAKEVTRRMGEAAKMAPPEARDLQAVPYSRIPTEDEVRIFLSHKSVDQGLVYRYHKALSRVGFSPWLDKEDMSAGSNLERSILKGFEESCAAVFFITKNFEDESFLATEVEYAVRQKRKKGSKFAIITLLFDPDKEVPGLLQSYVWEHVEDDLEGLSEVVRSLPIELGPVRWKAGVVS